MKNLLAVIIALPTIAGGGGGMAPPSCEEILEEVMQTTENHPRQIQTRTKNADWSNREIF